MIANYHTHTWRCNHASGTETEYIEAALQSGLKILGFSDHGPYIFPGDYYSNFRMKLKDLEDYVATVLSLREKFRGQICIPLGLELEYYPNLIHQLIPVLRDQPLDYLLLGQHFVGNEFDSPYSGSLTYDDRLLKEYVDQSIDGFQTGLFTYFAHPDLIHYCGDTKKYCQQMVRICREAKACDIPLEFNLLGLSSGRNYPNVDFWRLVAEEGCQVVIGRDAHHSQALLDRETLSKGKSFLLELGITPLEIVPLRSIG